MEENNKKRQLQRAVFVFTLVVCLSAIAGGLGSATFSNYFKEVYHVDSAQRGFLEIPRESPGVLCALIISALAGFSEYRHCGCFPGGRPVYGGGLRSCCAEYHYF